MDRDARVQELLYSCDSREELCERITRLEELVVEMWHELNYTSVRAENGSNECLKRLAAIERCASDLGIEVPE